MEGFFPMPPPHHPFQLHVSFIHFFSVFGLSEPPTPQEIPISSVGELWTEGSKDGGGGRGAGVPTRITLNFSIESRSTKFFFTNHASRKKKSIANFTFSTLKVSLKGELGNC